jgi:hypothetical protein
MSALLCVWVGGGSFSTKRRRKSPILASRGIQKCDAPLGDTPPTAPRYLPTPHPPTDVLTRLPTHTHACIYARTFTHVYRCAYLHSHSFYRRLCTTERTHTHTCIRTRACICTRDRTSVSTRCRFSRADGLPTCTRKLQTSSFALLGLLCSVCVCVCF